MDGHGYGVIEADESTLAGGTIAKPCGAESLAIIQSQLAGGSLIHARALLTQYGMRLVELGHAQAVLDTAAELAGSSPDERIATAVACARLMLGDWYGAQQDFARIAPTDGEVDPGIAWRMGIVEYLRGEIDSAEQIFVRGRLRAEPHSTDEAILLAWQASTCWIRGAYDEAQRLADLAELAARRSADPHAVTASQTVLSMFSAAAGDRCGTDSHHLAAVSAAERTGDVGAQIRLHANRGGHLNEQGLFTEALQELERAFELIDRYGYVPCRAMALSNQAEAYAALGRYDEAVESYVASRDAFLAMGSRAVVYPLAGLGLIHRTRGESARARTDFEQAARLAERVNNRQAMAAALAGLARVRAADNIAEAAVLADRATALGDGPRYVDALLAQGWIAILQDDAATARASAAAASDVAHRRWDEAGLAEALELSACSGSASATTDLADAAELWDGLGNPLGAARAKLLAGHFADERAAVAAATITLRELGVRFPWCGIADALAVVPAGRAPIKIQALGVFQVLRDDVVVPVTQWQSKKARDLLKILVSRRGRAITREEIIGLLWPDDDSAKVSNRLSVLLSTLRSVLNESPEGTEASTALMTDRCTVRLDVERVDLDVEHFLAISAAALLAWQRGSADAVSQLEQAKVAYRGDFCEEDVYEDWATHLREELRAVHLSVVRSHAAASQQAGQVDPAVHGLLTVLRHDPYDEPAHLELVGILHTAGRYGDARRHYTTYRKRMTEIAVTPSPFPTRTSPAE